MRRSKELMIIAVAGALVAGGTLPAEAQNWLGTPRPGDPFMQNQQSNQTWYTGPGQSAREARRGIESNLDSSYRYFYDRGYFAGRNDERMAGQANERGRREWFAEGRGTYTEARDYLDQARRQINQDDFRDAWLSLGRAETRLLTRATSANAGEQAAAGGAVGAIRQARQALENRNPNLAMDLTQQAWNMVRQGYIIGENVAGSSVTGG